MSVVLMQTYLFPYFGYFQLEHETNVFVYADDVNFSKGGDNRNRILLQTMDYYSTVPSGNNHNKMFSQIQVSSTLINK